MKFKKLFVFIIEFIFLLIFCFSTLSFANDAPEVNLDLCSEAAILIDPSTGQILYSKNENKKMYPASTTKILTAILAIENCALDEKVTASRNAVMSIPSGYSNAEIQVGEQLTVKELLEVFLVHSANEAGYILAEHISGSVLDFANLMNNKTIELGCENTHFTNPSGLHDSDHYTTAYDLSLIAKYCMKNSTFRSIVSMPSCTIAATDKHDERYFLSTNDMLNSKSKYYDENVIGIKTGFTTQAKNCLISGYNKNDIELISVILGASQTASNGLSGKFTDTKILFNYAMDNFSNRTLGTKGQSIKKIEIEHSTPETKNLDLILQNDIIAYTQNSLDLNTLNPEIKLNENITSPIAKNDILGTISYTIDGITYTENLIASHDVESSNFLGLILKILFGIIILFVVYELMYSKKKIKKSKKKYVYGRVKY